MLHGNSINAQQSIIEVSSLIVVFSCPMYSVTPQDQYRCAFLQTSGRVRVHLVLFVNRRELAISTAMSPEPSFAPSQSNLTPTRE